MVWQAVEYFVKLLHDLDAMCSYSLNPHLESLLCFVVQFQKSQPDLVARAHLQVRLAHLHSFCDWTTVIVFFSLLIIEPFVWTVRLLPFYWEKFHVIFSSAVLMNLFSTNETD